MSCCGPQRPGEPLRACELPDEADLQRFGSDGVRCPSCGSEVYFDAVQCHTCGLVMSDAVTATPRPGWIPVVAGVTLVAFVLVFVLL